MNYSVDALETVRNREKTINEFYLVIRSIMQQQDQLSSIDQHWNSTDLSLHNYLLKSQDNIDLALKVIIFIFFIFFIFYLFFYKLNFFFIIIFFFIFLLFFIIFLNIYKL